MTDVEIIKQIKKDIYQSFYSDDYIDKFLFKSILHHVITLEIYENNNIDGISFESICANVPKSIGSRSSIQSILNEALEKTIFTKEQSTKDKRIKNYFLGEKYQKYIDDWMKRSESYFFKNYLIFHFVNNIKYYNLPLIIDTYIKFFIKTLRSSL